MSQTLGKGTSVGNSQMEWLYDSSSGKPTNDDYLMGKAVDKNFERMGTEGQINAVEYDCCPESIFSSQVDHQVDLQRKLQEDPLVSLRKKEVDTRKKILDNPLKLREITSYVSTCYFYLDLSANSCYLYGNFVQQKYKLPRSQSCSNPLLCLYTWHYIIL